MHTLETLLFILQIIVAVALIGFVLIQHGKGADTGAAFGSGASSTVFGSRGSGNFLTRTTTVLAVIFLGNSLFLGYLSTQMTKTRGSLLDDDPMSVMQPHEVQQPVDGGAAQPVPVDTATAPVPDFPMDMPQGGSSEMPADVPVIPGTSELPTISDVPELPRQ